MPERKDWDDGARATGSGIVGTVDANTSDPATINGSRPAPGSPLASTGGVAADANPLDDEGRHYRRDGGG